MSGTWQKIRNEVLNRDDYDFCHEILKDDEKWSAIEKECQAVVEQRMAKGEIIAGTDLLVEIVKKYLS